jgi:hypothetical protein
VKTLVKYLELKLSAILITFIVLAILFASCNGKKNENQSVEYSNNGINLSKSLIVVYQKIDSIFISQNYDQELLRILNDDSPETYNLKLSKNKNSSINQYNLNAFRSLEKIFVAYSFQVDNKSKNTSELGEKIYLACKALDSMQMREELKAKNEKIKYYVNNKNFQSDAIMFEITNLFAQFWAEESQKWILSVNNNYDSIKKDIESIPLSSINTDKIHNVVDEPYSNTAVLANLYKLSLIKKNQQISKDIENKVNTINDAFNAIHQLQGEFLKRNKNKVKIQELNASLELILMN